MPSDEHLALIYMALKWAPAPAPLFLTHSLGVVRGNAHGGFLMPLVVDYIAASTTLCCG